MTADSRTRIGWEQSFEALVYVLFCTAAMGAKEQLEPGTDQEAVEPKNCALSQQSGSSDPIQGTPAERPAAVEWWHCSRFKHEHMEPVECRQADQQDSNEILHGNYFFNRTKYQPT